ncbi:MAG TPA: hypothetical protein GXZ36_02370 [Firmicutes bacterium]|nr:hypothetical protein [Bacillota bacterium]
MSKNLYIVGTLAGLAGNALKMIMTWAFYWLGFLDYTFCHLCAGMVISPARIREPLSVFIGVLLDYTVASFFGLFAYYIYLKTGGGYYWLRGVGFGVFTFLVCCGVLCPVFSVATSRAPQTAFFYLLPNLLYGLSMMAFICRHAPYFQELKDLPPGR